MDTQSQEYVFEKELYILNRLGIFSDILITPVHIILAQKCITILDLPRNKGRDFYYVVFLSDIHFLRTKAGMNSLAELKEKLLYKWSTINVDE